MPRYSYVQAPLHCPECNTYVADILCILWGYSTSSIFSSKDAYQIGDAIRWRACRDGSVPAWSYFTTEPGQPPHGNIGDPSVRDLVVRDWWYRSGSYRCPEGHRIGGGAVEIRDGVVTRVWLHPPGEFEDDETDIYLIADDGQLLPMGDWWDHSMTKTDASC